MPIDEEVRRNQLGEDSPRQRGDFADQTEEFANKTTARKFCIEHPEWFSGSCRRAMSQTGCPTPHSCGEELHQEQLIKADRIRDEVWDGVEEPLKYYSIILRRAAVEMKQECGCGDAADIEDAEELDDLIAAERPDEVWKDALTMGDLILFREVIERLDPDEQTILALIVEGYKAPAIARALGIKAGAARQRKKRLLDKLRRLFSNKTGEGGV